MDSSNISSGGALTVQGGASFNGNIYVNKSLFIDGIQGPISIINSDNSTLINTPNNNIQFTNCSIFLLGLILSQKADIR